MIIRPFSLKIWRHNDHIIGRKPPCFCEDVIALYRLHSSMSKLFTDKHRICIISDKHISLLLKAPFLPRKAWGGLINHTSCIHKRPAIFITLINTSHVLIKIRNNSWRIRKNLKPRITKKLNTHYCKIDKTVFTVPQSRTLLVQTEKWLLFFDDIINNSCKYFTWLCLRNWSTLQKLHSIYFYSKNTNG